MTDLLNAAPLDLLLLAIAALVLPVLSIVNGRALARNPDAPLISRYLRTMARGWFVVALIALDWHLTRRPSSVLGLDIPPGPGGRLGLVLVTIIALAMIFVLLNLRRFIKPERHDALRTQMRHIKILPRTTVELIVFLGVAITAGIWEELLYRGFLIWFLGSHFGVVAAVAVSVVLFGIGHIYQGWRGAMNATTLGFLFTVAFVASGSLWWVMVAHALVDIYGGLVAWRVMRMTA
jgi:membrane protease YdiL (CAAX protease family)